jgi:MFS family permease
MLASLIAAVASGEIFGAVRRARGAAVAYLLALFFGLAGVTFLVVAAWIAAARRWGDIEAAAIFGVGFILLAIIVVVVHKLLKRTRERSLARQRGVDMATVAGAAAVSLLPLLLRGKSRLGIGTLVAPLVAVAAYAIWREHTTDRKPPDDGAMG